MKKNLNFIWTLLIIIIVAVIAGFFIPVTSKDSISIYNVFNLVSQLFINALTLIVMPLISASIIVGVMKIAKNHSFGRVGGKTIGIFLLLNFSAILIGFVITNIFSEQFFTTAQNILTQNPEAALAAHTHPVAPMTFYEIILQIIPSNIIEAFSKNQILGLIFFSIVFGYAISQLKEAHRQVLSSLFDSVFQAFITFTHYILKFLPIAVFCLVAKHIADTGIQTLLSLGFFVLIMLISMFVFAFIVLPIVFKAFTRYSFFAHIRNMSPALITAFSTSSSSASLPITLDCMEKNVGVSNRIASLVVPLGTSLNMACSALYAYIGAFFLLQFLGVENSLWLQISLFFYAFICSFAIAGIPSAGIITVIIILKGFGVTSQWVTLLFAVDRLIDMFRSSINILTVSVSTVIIAHFEKEKSLYKKKIF